MKVFVLTILILLFTIFTPAQKRFIAVTIDDLPVVSTRTDLKNRQQITRKILAQIAKNRAPVIGFVNEGKLYNGEKRDEAQVDLLRQWLKAGLQLGNHTYSHLDLHSNSLEKYEGEILKGETITKELLKDKGLEMRYFRHPFLHTGMDMETKKGLGDFLTAHGYTIAPVTIDNSDWIFARAYDNAFDKKDIALQKRVGAAYVPYMERKMDYWERQSNKLFGREINQILLIHANFINSDYLDALLKMLKKRGYEFITLDAALKDEAFKLPDTYDKRNGISWLHRWAIARGKGNVLPDEPATPDFVMKAAGVDSE